MGDMNAAVSWMERIAADDRHGYSQIRRNGPDYDCSSFVGTALARAGFPVSKYSTTRNLGEQLEACGFVRCGKPWKRGDIHIAAGHHVTMSTDASRIVHASQSETGGIDGQTGDQTGREICVRSYYDLPYDNVVHYRYVGAKTKPQKVPEKAVKTEMALGFNKKIAGAYHTNDRYNLRVGAGTNKTIILTLPTGTAVRNYGYYTRDWYLVKTVVQGISYTGYIFKEGLTRG